LILLQPLTFLEQGYQFMRLDKFLKVSRIIKRRTVANDACDAGRVLVNGKAARASYDVKTGDILELQLGSRSVKAQVLEINEYATRDNATDMYKILSDE
jgi:ribosomal 50S subunit-recycling heat shock protein